MTVEPPAENGHLGRPTSCWGSDWRLRFIAHLLQAAVIPGVGTLTDRIGRKPVYITGAALTMVWPVVAFPMLKSGQSTIVLAAILTGMAVHALMYSAQPAIMAEMFPTRMLYSGVSVGYHDTAIVAGSWAPLIGTALLRRYDDWRSIAIYIAVADAVSLVSASVMAETRGKSLVAIDLEDQLRLTNARDHAQP